MADGIKVIISMVVQDLRTRNFGNIVDIIKKSEFQMDHLYHDNWDGGIDYYVLIFFLKYSDYLTIEDKKAEYEGIIHASFNAFYPNESEIIQSVEIRPQIVQFVDWAAIYPKENKTSVLSLLNEEKEILVKTGTAVLKINDVNQDYITNHKYINGLLKSMCLEPTNAYNDLWDWYKDYKIRNLVTYQSRRDYIQSLYEPLLSIIENSNESTVALSAYELTGWDKIDESVMRMQNILSNASTTMDYQSVGLFGRELLVSLAQAVFDKEKHFSLDGVDIGTADSKRMLESYINYCMKHKNDPRAIKYAKSASL